MRAIIVSLLLIFAPLISLAESEAINAGFVQGLWFSEQPIFAGDTVRVYVAVRNNTDSDLSGRVSFYDNDKRFERMNVQALSGRIVEAWADWAPSYGEHTLRADLSSIEIETIGTKNQNATVTAALAETTIFIDYDTDGDGEGNFIDEDDDNDGISDEDEIENGTDPLTPEPTEKDTSVAETESSDSSEEQTSTSNTNSLLAPNNGPAGLEKYLADSRARSTILTFTENTNELKQRLDAYRDSRATHAQSSNTQTNEETSQVVDTGETITASNTQPTEVIGEITRTTTKQQGWFAKTLKNTISVTKGLLNFVYTWVLTGVSALLGHPVLLQVLLLCILLFLVLKLAQKLSKRPD